MPSAYLQHNQSPVSRGVGYVTPKWLNAN